MMARSRADVDALNHRARTAALADGAVGGPLLAHAGGRDWQTGDILRARRNNRRLRLGESHLRNGDRFRVTAAAPGGLVVQDLAGRGRLVLPMEYLAAHATYGWAATIDAAQGATADIAILLARPGLDREHLYVAMSRGRHANHVHVTGAPTGDYDHKAPVGAPPVATLDDAVATLQAAVVRVGAESSAHTLLDQQHTAPRTVPAPPPAPAPAPAPALTPAELRRRAELQHAADTIWRRSSPPPTPDRGRSLSR